MSGFAGILHLDGAPGTVHDVHRLGEPPTTAWTWDEAGHHTEGPVAWRWHSRWTTPEAGIERQPVVSADQRFVLSYSGRIDNRNELISRYGATAGATDGALLAAVMSRDGAPGLRHCVGDFALAAWDRAERRLWLARDALGQRPLYYTHDRLGLMWSTDLRVLRAGAARAFQPNAGWIAEYLSDCLVSQDETAFDGIRRVRPAHALSISPGDLAPAALEYWTPPQSMPARRSDRDYIDEFRDRLTMAVAACTRAREPVAAELSGGLDSSSIVALTAALTGAPPDTYSIVYPGSPYAPDGERLDETEFIDVMTAAVGAASSRHDPRVTGRDDVLRVMHVHGDLPDWPNSDLVRWPMMRAAAAAGHRVMLTGVGGDQWLSGSVARVPAMMRAGHWIEAAKFFLAATRPDGIEPARWPALRRLTAASAPSFIKRAYRSMRPARPWPAWLQTSFAEETGLAARLRALPDHVSARDPVLRDSLMRLAGADQVRALESAFRSADDAGMEVRHPYFDRRVVEFVLTLPDDLRFRDGLTRYVLRQAMGAQLPPPIAARRDKGDATILFGHGVRVALAGVSLNELRVADRGWIDGDWMRAACAELQAPGAAERPLDLRHSLVWNAVAVELWLRTLDDGR